MFRSLDGCSRLVWLFADVSTSAASGKVLKCCNGRVPMHVPCRREAKRVNIRASAKPQDAAAAAAPAHVMLSSSQRSPREGDRRDECAVAVVFIRRSPRDSDAKRSERDGTSKSRAQDGIGSSVDLHQGLPSRLEQTHLLSSYCYDHISSPGQTSVPPLLRSTAST